MLNDALQVRYLRHQLEELQLRNNQLEDTIAEMTAAMDAPAAQPAPTMDLLQAVRLVEQAVQEGRAQYVREPTAYEAAQHPDAPPSLIDRISIRTTQPDTATFSVTCPSEKSSRIKRLVSEQGGTVTE